MGGIVSDIAETQSEFSGTRRRRASGANSASMSVFKQNECGSEIRWGRTVILWMMMTANCPSEAISNSGYRTAEYCTVPAFHSYYAALYF